MYYLIRKNDFVTIMEFDSLEQLMEEYKDQDIVAKKITVIPVPEN